VHDCAALLPLAGAESAARLTLGGRHDRGGHKSVIRDMPRQTQVSDGRASGGGGGCAIGSGSLRWAMTSGDVLSVWLAGVMRRSLVAVGRGRLPVHCGFVHRIKCQASETPASRCRLNVWHTFGLSNIALRSSSQISIIWRRRQK